jgi:monofunctional biosynthetic peptidoglycan transglycosylase
MTRKADTQAKTTKKAPARPMLWVARRVRRIWRRVFWIAFKSLMIAMTAAALLVLIFRVLNPPVNIYIASEWYRLGEVKRDWTRIEDFPDYVPRSVVAAEDANFCLHSGFDFKQIQSALNGKGKLRGASTLSQQTSKNVFLWQGRSWVRKGLEAGFTVLVELIWPKRRIVEVYLNVAEFDEGVFGVAAAGRHYFGVEPDRITRLQAARLAAILPNPKTRSASRPSGAVRKRTSQILSGEETIAADGRANCFQ